MTKPLMLSFAIVALARTRQMLSRRTFLKRDIAIGWLACLFATVTIGNDISDAGQNSATPRSTYSLGEFRLGNAHFTESALRNYKCAPSELWPQLARCTRERRDRERRGSFTVTEALLVGETSGLTYANRFINPAFWSGNEVEEDIDRLTKKFNEVPTIQRMPHRIGLPEAVIATWGGITLEPLTSENREVLARGGSPGVGILVDYLGDFTQSVQQGLPVYKIGGTAGAVWIGSFDRRGRGSLRYLIADASAMDERVDPSSALWTEGEPLGSSGWVYSERYSGGSLDQCQVRSDVQAVNGTEAVLTVAILSKGTLAILVEDEEWTRRVKFDWGWNEGQRFDNVSVMGNDAEAAAHALTMPNLQFAVFLKGDGLLQLRKLVSKDGLAVSVGGLTFKAWQLADFAPALDKLSKCNLARSTDLNGSNQNADRKAEFVFGLDAVCSMRNEEACVEFGSPWHAIALKKALPGYELSYSNECEGDCFLAQSNGGILEILEANGKVAFLRSLSGSVDFQGNAIGDNLQKAVGRTATCSSGLNFVCWGQHPIGYIVEGCEIKLKGIADKEEAAIPDCAIIAGFELSGSE